MKRIIFFGVFIILALFMIHMVSCDSMPGGNAGNPISGQDSKTPLPYVFEGVMQAGIEKAPPVEVILDIELPGMPDKAPVYRVENVDENYITSLARNLDFNNKPGQPTNSQGVYTYVKGWDYTPMTAAPSELEELVVYPDGRMILRADKVRIENHPKNLPSYEEAVKIAKEWLVSNDLYPANVASVEKGGGLTVHNTETGETTPYSIIVKFMTQLNGFDLYSPSAAVTVGDNGKILEAYISMSQFKDYGTVNLKSPEVALNILKAHLSSHLANPPEAKESIINLRNFERLNITRVSLQYMLGGGYLQPVYVFEGSAFSQRNPNLDAFRGKVDAVLR